MEHVVVSTCSRGCFFGGGGGSAGFVLGGLLHPPRWKRANQMKRDRIIPPRKGNDV